MANQGRRREAADTPIGAPHFLAPLTPGRANLIPWRPWRRPAPYPSDTSPNFEHVEAHPNLFFDTSWWGRCTRWRCFTLVPLGRVLTASDLPYCTPLSGAITTLRCGIQAGLTDEQVRLTMGGQFTRLLAWEDPVDAGPAPGRGSEPLDPLLERLFVTLLTGVEARQRDEDPGNAIPVARHACKVPAWPREGAPARVRLSPGRPRASASVRVGRARPPQSD